MSLQQKLKILWHLSFWGFYFYSQTRRHLGFPLPLPAHLATCREDDPDAPLINYYCKRQTPFDVSAGLRVDDIPTTGSSDYFYDLYPLLCRLPASTRFFHLFGDITHHPDIPTFVKSRPIAGENHNSIVLPLETRRHLRFYTDSLPYQDKINKVVWRGAAYQPARKTYLEKMSQFDFCDVADTSRYALKDSPGNWMTPQQQLRHKILFSVEGNDVASNLKWILASRSLCFTFKPRYETWVREGQLQPGVHYVEIADDLSDLAEKFHYYSRNIQAAEVIIANANAYMKSFASRQRQLEVGIKVVIRYLQLSGQAVK